METSHLPNWKKTALWKKEARYTTADGYSGWNKVQKCEFGHHYDRGYISSIPPWENIPQSYHQTSSPIRQHLDIKIQRKPKNVFRLQKIATKIIFDNHQRQRRTEEQTRSSIQDQLLRLSRLLHRWDWQKPRNQTDWTQTSDEERRCQQSHCWTSPTNEPHYWLGLCVMPNLQHQLLSTTDPGKLVY